MRKATDALDEATSKCLIDSDLKGLAQIAQQKAALEKVATQAAHEAINQGLGQIVSELILRVGCPVGAVIGALIPTP